MHSGHEVEVAAV